MEFAEAPVSGTEHPGCSALVTYWDLNTQCWDILGPIHSVLGPAVPPALRPPALADPLGAPELLLHEHGPLLCVGLVICRAQYPPRPLPPDKPGGRDSVSGLFGESHGCLLGSGTH